MVFGRKKEAPVDFFKAKAGVFLERLYNGIISKQTYDRVIRRILYVEGILKRYPFYAAYRKGSASKKHFLRNLKWFYPDLIKNGISRKEFQEILHQAELNETISFEKVVKEEIEVGNIKGIIFRRGEGHRNGIVLCHPISASRYALLNLAEILSQLGYLVLAIDLPKHYKNQGLDLTLGNMSELIRDSVIYLRKVQGVRYVAIVGHSLGAIGTLLASVGYTRTTEREIYVLWERIRGAIKRGEKYSRLRPGLKNVTLQQVLQDEGFMNFLNEISAYYKRIKEIILESLKRRDQLGENFVNCCVMLSMPAECKKTFVGASLLKVLPRKWLNKVWETLFHNPAIKKMIQKGDIANYGRGSTNALKWVYLRVENPYEFIDYFTTLKEPADYISLMSILSRFSHKENKISFIEYYMKRYLLSIPKLFIYGRWDVLLRPWFKSRKEITEMYGAYGNAKIIRGSYGHILTNKPLQQALAPPVTSDVVTQNVIYFLNRHMAALMRSQKAAYGSTLVRDLWA